MATDVFRLEQPVTAFREEAKSHCFLTIPAGSVLTVVRLLAGIGLVEVEWNGQMVEVYLRDLRDGGVLLDGAGCPVPSGLLD